MPILELITASKDVLLAIAGATTAIVAVIGLQNWNRQLRGTAYFDVARGMAKATYKLRDEIQICRSPLIRAGEFPSDYKNFGSDKNPETESHAYAFVFSNRWQPVYAAIQAFDTQTLEAEALWGASIREKTNQVRDLLRTLNAAIDAYVSNSASGNQDFQQDREFGVKIRSEVFASPTDKTNVLSSDLDAAIQAIESELRPHLKRG